MNGGRRKLRSPLVLAVSALALFASLALAMSALGVIEHGEKHPKKGTYTGATSGGEPITLKVKKHGKVKVNFCNYSMGGEIKKRGKFSVAHTGPGGVYVAVKGQFSDKTTATGTIPVDFLCETEGQGWSAEHK